MNKESERKSDKPIKSDLGFEDILEGFLKVKPPEKKKSVKKEKSKTKTASKGGLSKNGS